MNKLDKTSKKTVVLGASSKIDRYSNRAVKQLMANGHLVIPIGFENEKINGLQIETALLPIENVNTISLYLNPKRQEAYYDYILSLNPKRIIFNPGTENRDLEQLAKKLNIETIEACTLVMLSVGNY
ncbi:MAG: CoA-binding protein [Bacteroidetes bacterium]|nr:CoA-binding protein [Bacteroidota bacterium]MBK8674658.1 CoA-binding protein [Bacteroidota bacterium]MBL0080357.1 CoA-binding protein [Bacteroidota bacterium]